MFRIRSTFLYFAVALGLFCYLYFVDSQRKSTDATAMSAGNLYEFDADEVNWMQITNASGTVLLEKQDNRWKITKPVQALPEGGIIQQILTELEYARTQRTISYGSLPGNKEETIKQWSLNPPVVRVEFKTPKSAHVLLIGRNVALTETVYARASDKSDAPVNIVRANIKSIVDKSLSELRSRSVFDFDSTTISKCATREFTSGAQAARDVELSKDKEGRWSLQKPLVARADKARVDAWMRQVQDLRVIDFISDEGSNLSAYGLTSPTAQITLQKPDNGEELSLLIGVSPADKPALVYAKRVRSNSVFTLNKEAVTKLLAGLMECRDKKLVSLQADEVNRFVVEDKGRTLTFVKKDGLWSIDGPSGGVAEVGRVQDFLNRMTSLQAAQFVKDSATDLKPYGLDKPSAKVTLAFTRGKGKEKESGSVDILFGKIDKKEIYARNSAEPFIYSVPVDILESFPRSEIEWRSLQVVRGDKAKLKEISVTVGTNTMTLTRQPDGTYAVNADGQIIDKDKVEPWVNTVCSLRAVDWLGKPLPAYGLDKPALRLVVTADEVTTLRVGAPLPTGGQAAQVEGQALVFELSLSDFNLLTQPPVITKR